MAADQNLIIGHYRSGLTLRECAALFGVSMQRIHQIIQKFSPNIMRPPHVVPKRRRRTKGSGKYK